MATTKITSPDSFNLENLNTALKLPSGTTAQRPTSPSTGEWRYNTTTNLVEFYDGGAWRELQSEDIPPTPSENFNVVLYTGNGTSQSITGVGFKPDFVWVKDRVSSGEWNMLSDSTRGTNSQLFSNATNAPDTKSTVITSFDSDGFSIGSDNLVNNSGKNYVAWCWKANEGTTSSNTDGSITSTVQANTKAGFSIVSYTGDGANGTVGHGLGVAPEIVIPKRLNSTGNWSVNGSVGGLTYGTNKIKLNDADAISSDTNEVIAATATTFTAGASGSVGASGGTYIAYCFHSVDGFSKIGSYTGNGSTTNGPTITTGFEPAMIIIKRTDSGEDWKIIDNKRSNFANSLEPNEGIAEEAGNNAGFTLLSTGFQIGDTSGDYNANGGTYLYMAFASDASAAPVLADSFANKIYSGNGGTQSITGLGFSPGWVWGKRRSATEDNAWFDILRGAERQLTSNKTNVQNVTTNAISSFDSDGWTTGANNALNTSGQTYVAWNWKVNPVATTNTDGTIQSIVSANQAAGISIVKYTGTGSSGAYGHGLSSSPDLIITKRIDAVEGWLVWSSSLSASNYMYLNSSGAAGTDTNAYKTIDATTNQIGTDVTVNASGGVYISYCFTSISGFSDFGSYTGNGSAGYAITGLGFQPSFIMIKGTTSADNWFIFDSARGGSVTLNPNLDAAEYADTGVTSFDSDGFTLGSNAGGNRNGDTYIYMAFKENPAQYPIPSGQMGYLVVAGGGSGGAHDAGSGGAGGLRTSYGALSGGGAVSESDITLATGTYTITVGAGGAAIVNPGGPTRGNAGTDSVLNSITSIGGGEGGTNAAVAGNGGSGGGGTGSYAAGSGTTGQGFQGGTGTPNWTSGGGGGASEKGQDSPGNEIGGDGGNGLAVSITGSNVSYAGGGGGAGGTTLGQGGQGGGGAGGNGSNTPAGSGQANTGGGGGAQRNGGATASGAGGSGVVILRLNTSDYSGVTSGAPTITTIGSETILKYTASGGYAHNYDIPAGSMAYLVVAGGGGSGNEGSSFTTSGAGGGAGGLRTSYGLASGGGTSNESFLSLSAGTYTITIGAGGGTAANGSASTITGNGSVATVGGGAGGQNSVGSTGGSGGGGGSNRSGSVKYNGGAGTTGEGFGGSIGDVFFWSAIGNDFAAGGGGGGAASAAVTINAGTTGAAGEGGDGLPVGITGSNNYYAAGGGGFKIGLAVNGLGHHSTDGQPGQNNTGDGAPKWSGLSGFSGGSGVVVLRMKTTDYSGTTTGSPTVTTDGYDTILTFTGSGTYVHS